MNRQAFLFLPPLHRAHTPAQMNGNLLPGIEAIRVVFVRHVVREAGPFYPDALYPDADMRQSAPDGSKRALALGDSRGTTLLAIGEAQAHLCHAATTVGR